MTIETIDNLESLLLRNDSVVLEHAGGGHSLCGVQKIQYEYLFISYNLLSAIVVKFRVWT